MIHGFSSLLYVRNEPRRAPHLVKSGSPNFEVGLRLIRLFGPERRITRKIFAGNVIATHEHKGDFKEW
jgi:hypothetical protein